MAELPLTLVLSVQGASYWSAMLSTVEFVLTRCDSRERCHRPVEGARGANQFHAISTPWFLLSPASGKQASMFGSLEKDRFVQVECDDCHKAFKSSYTKWAQAPVVLSMFAAPQQVGS